MATKVGERSREAIIALICETLKKAGYDVLQTASNAYAVPIVEDGEEGAIRLKVEIPKGARDGEGYDPFEAAEAYSFKQNEKAIKAAKAAAKKAKKEKGE